MERNLGSGTEIVVSTPDPPVAIPSNEFNPSIYSLAPCPRTVVRTRHRKMNSEHVPWELMFHLEMETEEGMTGGGQDYISQLPDECLASIFNCLDSGNRKNISLVSKRMLKVEGQSRWRLTLHATRPDLLPSLLSRFDASTELVIQGQRRSVIDADDVLSGYTKFM